MDQEQTVKLRIQVGQKPEKFVICKTCGSILGFTAHVDGALFLFLFAYPITGPRPDMENRRVNARMLSGDVHCPRCCTWQAWTAANERPWEKRGA